MTKINIYIYKTDGAKNNDDTYKYQRKLFFYFRCTSIIKYVKMYA